MSREVLKAVGAGLAGDWRQRLPPSPFGYAPARWSRAAGKSRRTRRQQRKSADRESFIRFIGRKRGEPQYGPLRWRACANFRVQPVRGDIPLLPPPLVLLRKEVWETKKTSKAQWPTKSQITMTNARTSLGPWTLGLCWPLGLGHFCSEQTSPECDVVPQIPSKRHRRSFRRAADFPAEVAEAEGCRAGTSRSRPAPS